MRACRAACVLLLLARTACAQDEPRLLSAREIVARWRDAAESRREPLPHTARFKSVLREGRDKTKITEWITSPGDYRRLAKRNGKRLEVVLLGDRGMLRDWDGSVRPLVGRELECWRSVAFETKTLAFGPSSVITGASVEISEDRKAYELRGTPPGAAAMTWYVDPQTFLPARTVIAGCGDLDTEYSDWREKNLVFTAFRARVREAGEAEYELERKDAKIDKGAKRFHLPQPK